MSAVTKETRIMVYEQMFKFMIKMDTHVLPTPLELICEQNGFGLTPLSEIKKITGYTDSDIFELWGNENGATVIISNKYIEIMYNDNSTHIDRCKFTIAEEICHCVLGHIKNPTYNIERERDNTIYKKHEKCARIGAGLLICPPPVFYEFPHLLNTQKIKMVCGISEPCAEMRYNVLEQYKEEIQSNRLYDELSHCYEDFMDSIPCERCGNTPIIRHEGICSCCYNELASEFLPALSM